ncbi:MAG TPA: type II secretion system protein [Tepidisphaeraceae bacterium]|jgi:prepilin-type N-terminal cleavage/methylation domain-containing protein/prepilin-type processing-associated H-X9-DG protein
MDRLLCDESQHRGLIACRCRAGERAFSLVELLVVLGIIALIISLLMPALAKARAQSKFIACQSNLREIGQEMIIYANNSNGWLFPPDDGNNGIQVQVDQRWFVFVLKPHPPADPNDQNIKDWTPPIMICPADDPEPVFYHSYLLNHHLIEHAIRYSTKPPAGLDPSHVVVMGEKKSDKTDYYVETYDGPPAYSSYDVQAETYRHGVGLGSNYLYLDLHVDDHGPTDITYGLDPWDFPPLPTTAPATGQ